MGLTIANATLLLIHPIFAFILVTWVTVLLHYRVKLIQNLSHVFAEARSSWLILFYEQNKPFNNGYQ